MPLLGSGRNSDAVWSDSNRGSLVKSPVDLVVGTLRTFSIRPVDLRPAVFACAALGQNLFAPPNVKGWPGGDAWINASTLLGRRQFVDRVFRGADEMATPMPMNAQGSAPGAALARTLERGMADYVFDAERFAASLGRNGDERLERLVLAYPAVNAVEAQASMPDRVRALVADASYQLK
jgi:hypothetical protein